MTARAVLVPLLSQPGDAGAPLLPSEKTGTAPATRGLGYLVAKYAAFARVKNLPLHDLRHHFGYQMAARTPLHRLTQIMGHDSLDTTMLYIKGAACDLQNEAEKIAWE
ncbi:MAG: tyrosine-type recombinase/integrase [Roseiflexus sp.]|uniref:tyrosine-type recombinase/integrase n=1 Tax=Roseiflexus sp. TaxID=2562120 RepID=UPI0025FBFD8F|nr:tyrosine-type recombinase/integrase [Roseiflexus sp.]MCL6540560.1 tyrosine-type recombinase/integrase [Roseiflexus sp.]